MPIEADGRPAELGEIPSCPPGQLLNQPEQDRYIGIPDTLLATLVEVYFDNVYNADLLLHRRRFSDAIAEGTVRP